MRRGVIATVVGVVLSSAVLLGLIWGGVTAVYLTQQGTPMPGGLAWHLAESVLMMLQWVLGVGVFFAVGLWLLLRGDQGTPEPLSVSPPDALPGEGYAEQTTVPKP